MERVTPTSSSTALFELHGDQGVEAEAGERALGIDRPGGLRREPRQAGEGPGQPALGGRDPLRPRRRQQGLAQRPLGRLGLRRRVQPAAPHHRQLPREIELAAAAALDLAAGRLRHASLGDQQDLVDQRLVLLGHRAPHRLGDSGEIRRVAIHLVDHHQPLLPLDLHREGGARAGPQGRMGVLGRQLDILRIVIAPAQDDEVLHAAGDEQLAAVEEAEVSRAQPGRGIPRQPGAEGTLALLRPVPVAAGHAVPRHPDLADPPLGQRLCGSIAGFRLHDRHPQVEQHAAGADQLAGVRPGSPARRGAPRASRRRRSAPRRPRPAGRPRPSASPRPGRSRGRAPLSAARSRRRPRRSGRASRPAPARRR